MVLHSRGQMHMQCTIFRCIEAKGVYEFFVWSVIGKLFNHSYCTQLLTVLLKQSIDCALIPSYLTLRLSNQQCLHNDGSKTWSSFQEAWGVPDHGKVQYYNKLWNTVIDYSSYANAYYTNQLQCRANRIMLLLYYASFWVHFYSNNYDGLKILVILCSWPGPLQHLLLLHFPCLSRSGGRGLRLLRLGQIPLWP